MPPASRAPSTAFSYLPRRYGKVVEVPGYRSTARWCVLEPPAICLGALAKLNSGLELNLSMQVSVGRLAQAKSERGTPSRLSLSIGPADPRLEGVCWRARCH